MVSKTNRLSKAAITALALVTAGIAPTIAAAGEVTLKSSDGTLNLTGELLDFKDDNYIVKTALGELRVSAARVRCEGASCPTFDIAKASLTIKGSDTVGLGLMPLLVSGYASFLDADAAIKSTDREGEILADLVADGGFGDEIGTILVSSTSSGDAFTNLLEQKAELGMASRRIKPAEARALRDSGAGNMVSPQQEHIVAVDSLVVITHPSNPINEITIDQLRDIYSGRISNWKDLGGADAPIKVLNRQDGSGTRSVLETALFSDGGSFGGKQTEVDSNNTIASMVNDDPNAIGYVGYAFQRGAKPLNLVNECGILTQPDAFSAKVEEYTLQRRLYLYNRADTATDEMKDFVDFATSPDADGVIAKSGFIDLGISRKPQQMDSGRAKLLLNPNADAYEGGVMREMLSAMFDFDRLSTTFRFRTGSSQLDERGRVDMARLTDFLAAQPAGTKIKVVGFTDDVGAFASNLALSQNRAQQIAGELVAFAGDKLNGIEIATAGYGEVAPSACNTNQRGRSLNRRVEIWIEASQDS